MKHFVELTSRPQYTTQYRSQGLEGEGDECAELVPIARSCRLPEENEHRLRLADRVLSLAITVIECEANMDIRDEATEFLYCQRALRGSRFLPTHQLLRADAGGEQRIWDVNKGR
jgi:hypothetical protein